MLKFIIIPLVTMMLLLTSCSSLATITNSLRNYTDDSSEKAQAMLEQVIESIKTKNHDTIKNLFSEYALRESKDIDKGIDYIFSFVQGEIMSWEYTFNGGGEDIAWGKVTRRSFSGQCYVNTDKERYFFYLSVSIPSIFLQPDRRNLTYEPL